MQEIVNRDIMAKRIREYEESLSQRNGHKEKEHPSSNDAVEAWANWSLKPHTYDEIKEKLLNDFGGACITYICEKSIISEENFIEFAALSTGLVNNRNYKKALPIVMDSIEYLYGFKTIDEVDIKAYISLLGRYVSGNESQYRKTKAYTTKAEKLSKSSKSEDNAEYALVNGEIEEVEEVKAENIVNKIARPEPKNEAEKFFMSHVYDRIDWSGLCSRSPLSEEFLDKYNLYIDWKVLPVQRIYTPSFFEKYQDKLPRRVDNEFILDLDNN